MSIGSAVDEAIASVVVVPCASRKSVAPTATATAVSLDYGTQDEVETAWLARIDGLPAACRADELYRGRGFKLAREATLVAKARLYVASAGFGLVAADRRIPTYGLTIADGVRDSVTSRVEGRFDAARWWRAVSRGPMATSLETLSEGGRPVLVALTHPYARMLADDLARLRCRDRLRLIGTGLSDVLDPALRGAVMPYDDRLEGLLPGTRSDFPQRALLHFVVEVLRSDPTGTAADHSTAVALALSGARAPERAIRPRASDADIRAAIRRRLAGGVGVTRLLNWLRTQDGIACEQGRFGRLYREVAESEAP